MAFFFNVHFLLQLKIISFLWGHVIYVKHHVKNPYIKIGVIYSISTLNSYLILAEKELKGDVE